MQKIVLYLPVWSLFFIMALNTSCSRASNTNTLEKDSLPKFEIGSFKDLQVAEYIVEIFEDSREHLWLGTMSKGVARYDGKNLTYFTTKDGLPGNTVLSISEDRAGNLWFGTHTGASRFDGKTFTNFGEAEGLHGMGCNLLMDKNGAIWAGTNDGAFRFDGSRFKPFDIPAPDIDEPSYKWEKGKIWNLKEDSKGNIWFARDGLGVCKFDGTTFTHFTKKDGLHSNNVCSMAEDKAGNMWFGTLSSDFPEYKNEGGLSRYDGKTFTTFPDLEGLNQNDIYTIYADKSGNIWIGAIGHGVYRYDGENFTLLTETVPVDMVKRYGLQQILEDKKGRLWFGFSGGLFRLSGSTFFNITQNGPWQ